MPKLQHIAGDSPPKRKTNGPSSGGRSCQVHPVVPGWIVRLAEREARIRGGTKSGTVAGWISEYAIGRFPDDVPKG